MLRNLTITIRRPGNSYLNEAGEFMPAEHFNWDFAGLQYYYFHKLKKIKIPGRAWIEILITNEAEDGTGVESTLAPKALVIRCKCDFTTYLTLPANEKKKFQQELISYILKDAFMQIGLSTDILKEIDDELKNNNNNLEICFFTKKIKKDYHFKAMMYLEPDSFRFAVRLIEQGETTELLLIRSRPEIYIIHYLFKKWKKDEEQIKIGNQDQQVFQIDLEKKEVIVLEAAKKLFKEWYFK